MGSLSRIRNLLVSCSRFLFSSLLSRKSIEFSKDGHAGMFGKCGEQQDNVRKRSIPAIPSPGLSLSSLWCFQYRLAGLNLPAVLVVGFERGYFKTGQNMDLGV